MFEKLKKSAKLKIKNDGLIGLDLSRKDVYSKGYWEGFIYGLEMAEKQIGGKSKMKNAWTEKLEKLEKENAELEETIKIFWGALVLLGKVISRMGKN